MKLIAILSLAFLLSACNSSAPLPVSQGSNNTQNQNDKPLTTIGHSSENRSVPASNAPADAPKGKWSQGGEAIDTKQYDDAVKAAEKALAAKPTDVSAKKALSAAYFKRAIALTEPESRQYAAALGDFRRAVKNDPTNAEAKDWIEKITGIYASINKESPKEGEEPQPLPYTKKPK